jgi:hypothetical protein
MFRYPSLRLAPSLPRIRADNARQRRVFNGFNKLEYTPWQISARRDCQLMKVRWALKVLRQDLKGPPTVKDKGLAGHELGSDEERDCGGDIASPARATQ